MFQWLFAFLLPIPNPTEAKTIFQAYDNDKVGKSETKISN